MARNLRKQGFKVEIDMANRKIGKTLDRANKENVRNAIIIGQNEVRNNQFKVKDMVSGEERMESFNYN